MRIGCLLNHCCVVALPNKLHACRCVGAAATSCHPWPPPGLTGGTQPGRQGRLPTAGRGARLQKEVGTWPCSIMMAA